jgi:hypothetical protein
MERVIQRIISRSSFDWEKSMSEKDNGVQKFFDRCEDSAEITFVRGEGEEHRPCIIIGWSEKGRGFGEYTFFEEDGKWKIDNEADSREAIKRVLGRLVDSLPLVDEV